MEIGVLEGIEVGMHITTTLRTTVVPEFGRFQANLFPLIVYLIFKSCHASSNLVVVYTEKGNVILVVLIYPNTLQSVRFSAQCPLGRLNPVARILWLITQKRINQLQNLHLHFSKCQSTSTGPLPLFGIFFLRTV